MIDLEIIHKGEAATSSECDVTQGFEAAILNEYDVNSSVGGCHIEWIWCNSRGWGCHIVWIWCKLTVVRLPHWESVKGYMDILTVVRRFRMDFIWIQSFGMDCRRLWGVVKNYVLSLLGSRWCHILHIKRLELESREWRIRVFEIWIVWCIFDHKYKNKSTIAA